MDIEEIISDLNFPSEQARNTFVLFYDYLQEYMNTKKTNPDEFDKIEYFQNTNSEIVQLLMDDYINIFNETLFSQNEIIVLNWRIWGIMFRDELSEFFYDFVGFEVYKRNNKSSSHQRDLNSQSENRLLNPRTAASTPIASSRGIMPFAQKRSQRLSTIVGPYKPGNLNKQIEHHEITPSFSQYPVIRSPGQRLVSPMDIPYREENQTHLSLSNIISNQTEPLFASMPLIQQTDAVQTAMPLTEQTEPLHAFMPLTPSGTLTPARLSESLTAQRPIRRVRRKRKRYDVMTEDRPMADLNIGHRNRVLNPLNLVGLSNEICVDLPGIEMSYSIVTPINPIQIDSSRFDKLFDEIEISGEEIDLNQLTKRTANANHLSAEPSAADLLLPDLPRVSGFRNLRENLSDQPTQNILTEMGPGIRSIHIEDLSELPENGSQYIVTSAIVHKTNSPRQDLEVLREEICPLADLPQSSPELDDINQIAIDNQNEIRLQEPESQNLIEILSQNIVPVQQLEPQIQEQNEIIQHTEITANYQKKNWIEILRFRGDTPVNFKALYGSIKRNRHKRRRVKKKPEAAQINEELNLIPLLPPRVEELPTQVGPRGSLQDILSILDDFDQANVSLTGPENQLQIDLENQSELFKSKFIEWKDSYLGSNPGKYEKYLKISIENLMRDANALNDLKDILQLYTSRDSDMISSTELFEENLSSERKEDKKRVLKGLKEQEIIRFLNSNTSDQEDDIVFTMDTEI